MFHLKVIDFKMHLVVCGNFSVFVYKEAESQEIARTFTGSCSGLFWQSTQKLDMRSGNFP